MARSLLAVATEVRREADALVEVARQVDRRRGIPLAVFDPPAAGWLGRVLAAHAAPVVGRPPDSWVLLPDGSRVRAWLVRAEGAIVAVVDQRSEAEITADYERRAAHARRGTSA